MPIQDLDLESDLPISLGFILDTSGSMVGRKMKGSQELMTAFLSHRRQEDQIALWTFGDDRVMERFPFGMGWYLLPRVLETLKPWSTTAIYDMVLLVPEILEKAKHHRRAAILLTDGVDNASQIDADQATAVARRLETPIYVLGVEPPTLARDGDQPSYEEILTLIADSSGGHYRRIPRAEEMPEVVDEMLKELSSRYILTFVTSGVGAAEVEEPGGRGRGLSGHHAFGLYGNVALNSQFIIFNFEFRPRRTPLPETGAAIENREFEIEIWFGPVDTANGSGDSGENLKKYLEEVPNESRIPSCPDHLPVRDGRPGCILC